MFTRKTLTALIVPLILEQALNVTIGMADTMMVASCGEAAVSGISLVDSLNILLIQVFGCLATGGAVITSQYIGKGDLDSGCESANQLVISISVVAILIGSLALFFRQQILSMVFGAIDAEVMSNALIYFFISALSYPFLALYNAGAALFRAMGNSKRSLYTSILMNMINISGNALLIFGFKMGVTGAALATLFSRIVGSAIMIYTLTNKAHTIHLEKFFPIRLRWDMIKNILRIGIPSGLEGSMFQIGKVMVSSMVSTFGTVAIAANAVAGGVMSMQCITGGAIGMAMITVVGQCVGAREYDQAKHYTYKLMILNMVTIGVMCVITCLGAGPITAIYQLKDETADLAVKLIWFHGIFAPLFWPPSFSLPNALRAAGDVKFTMYVSMISIWVMRVLLSYFLGMYLGWGIYGIYCGMIADWFGRGIPFTIRFVKGKWQGKAYV